MRSTNYHRRYRHDGSCDIICTECFCTLGTALTARAAQAIEAGHTCHKRAPIQAAGSSAVQNSPKNRAAGGRRTLWQSLGDSARQPTYLPVTAICAILLFYALPTAAEMIAMEHVNLWLACILPGDLAGCVGIAALFRMPRIGGLLYLALTAIEGGLHVAHLLPARAFVWIVDLVPVLVMIGIMVYTSLAPEVSEIILSGGVDQDSCQC